MIMATTGFRSGMAKIVRRLIRSRHQTHASGFPSMSLGARRLHSVKRKAQVKCPINTVLQRGVPCMPRANRLNGFFAAGPNAPG